MSDCIFCKIAAGEIPSTTLYENEEFRIILDVGPASRGHALILPKAHYANLYEMPEDLLSRAFALAKSFGAKLVSALGADGLNIVQNNGQAAGQTVFHFHVHMIPRYTGQAPTVAWTPGKLSPEDAAAIAEAVAKA